MATKEDISDDEIKEQLSLFEKKDKNDDKDPGKPFFVGEIHFDKSLSGYIQYTIKVYNHKVSNSTDESEDQELASQTVYVRPVLCQ